MGKLTKREREVLGALTDVWQSGDALAWSSGLKGWCARENAMSFCRRLAKLRYYVANAPKMM